jgi:bacterioferritin (cytochrome b1)
MGFDLDRSEVDKPVDADAAAADAAAAVLQAEASGRPADQSAERAVFSTALSRNLIAERFAIDAYRKMAEQGDKYDKATLRLVKVALAVEEEHAEILSKIIENLRDLNGAPAG